MFLGLSRYKVCTLSVNGSFFKALVCVLKKYNPSRSVAIHKFPSLSSTVFPKIACLDGEDGIISLVTK